MLLAGGGAVVLFFGAVAPLLLLRVDVLPQPAAARHDGHKKAQDSEVVNDRVR